MRAAVLLLALLLPAVGAAGESRREQTGFWETSPADEVVTRLLERMTDDELLGQVFMIGYIGIEPSPELLHWIRARGLGGVKIFTRNVDTLPRLARSIQLMQEAAQAGDLGIPLLISTDQEGGWVRHIKGETSTTPGNLALGASGLPQDAYLTGFYIGEELRSLGINMNFAPTIDIYTNPSAAVIGPRAFSSDPVATAMLALAYYRGLSKTGVIATAKHFPGHGQADKDSHGALPIVTIDMDELWERELLPYRILISEGIPVIMSGHLAYPQILGDLTPSSRSPELITGVLRERMGFDGVLITDDMEMNGVLSGGLDTPQACLEALRAGNDMVLVSHTPAVQEQSWRRLRAELTRDPRFRERVKEAVRRLLRLKLRVFKTEGFPLAAQELDPARFRPSPVAEQFFAESALRAVTLIRDGGLPFRPGPGQRLLLVGQFEEFLEAGKARYPQADTLFFPYMPFYWARYEDLQRIPAAASHYDAVVLCLANYNSLEILEALKPMAQKLVVLSALSPVYLRRTPWVQTALAVYGTGRESFQAGFSALAGDFAPEGRLPVDFLDGYRGLDGTPPGEAAAGTPSRR